MYNVSLSLVAWFLLCQNNESMNMIIILIKQNYTYGAKLNTCSLQIVVSTDVF